jgi:hypothetical protein
MIIARNGPQNIGQVKRHFELGNLFLLPEEYQRENAWDMRQKTLLVDTVFRGMDIPKLYFWKINHSTLATGYPDGEMKNYYKEILEKKRKDNDEVDPYVFEIVDGQQRVRSLLEYMGVMPPNNQVYRGTWHESFKSLADTPMAKGRQYSQLNADQQSKYDESLLTIMIIEQATIDEIRDMFLRLQNGTPLNTQQKRDAMGSNISKIIREFKLLPFFATSVNFEDDNSAHNLVISQILMLEEKGKPVSCGSRKLDKFYAEYKTNVLDQGVVAKAKKTLTILGAVFPKKCLHINKSFAISLYFALSKITETYTIPVGEYTKIKKNFEKMDEDRLIAKSNEYIQPADAIYRDLSDTLGSGTDGLDSVSSRHDIICQFLFQMVQLTPLPTLDSVRKFSYEEKLILYKKCGGICQLEHNGKVCGKQIDYDDAVVDHIKPHSKGGKTELSNGRIAFNLCNIARGNREDFDPKTMCQIMSREGS